jgi:hypothetical protein
MKILKVSTCLNVTFRHKFRVAFNNFPQYGVGYRFWVQRFRVQGSGFRVPTAARCPFTTDLFLFLYNL